MRTFSLKEYEQFSKDGAKLYVTKQGNTVAVKGDGEIISLCVNYKDNLAAHTLLTHAVNRGGHHFTVLYSVKCHYLLYGCLLCQ